MQDEPEDVYALRHRVEQLASRFGHDLFRNDPLVHAAVMHISRGANIEDVLIALVRELVKQRDHFRDSFVKVGAGPGHQILVTNDKTMARLLAKHTQPDPGP